MTDHHSHKIAHIHNELHSHLPSDPALRVKALESLLIEKNLADPRTVDAWIEVYTEPSTIWNCSSSVLVTVLTTARIANGSVKQYDWGMVGDKLSWNWA